VVTRLPHSVEVSSLESAVALAHRLPRQSHFDYFQWSLCQRGKEVFGLRNYVPKDDGLEPTDFDEYYDVPARTDKGLAARIYIKIERDPKRAAHLAERRNAAIIELLQWARDDRTR
jgi:hypothetical protein